MDLNKEFGIYVCCIGCIGDISFFWLFNGCNFDDYLFGIGVLSCNFLYGCYGYVLIISSLYFVWFVRVCVKVIIYYMKDVLMFF